MSEGERKSRVQGRDVGEERLYLCDRRGWAVPGRGSDAALYPIGRAAEPGGCDSEFAFTNGTGCHSGVPFPLGHIKFLGLTMGN
jgi:hypothetical protein